MYTLQYKFFYSLIHYDSELELYLFQITQMIAVTIHSKIANRNSVTENIVNTMPNALKTFGFGNAKAN